MSITGGLYLGTPGNLGGAQPVGPQPVNPIGFPPSSPTGIPPHSGPISTGPSSPVSPGNGTAPTPPNYSFAPQNVNPTGPSQGFDPQFLQNLTTYIGGLFSRPQGNLSFNPLGNLSDVPSQQLGYGNAPLFGLPNTLLQDALNNSLSNGTPVGSATPGSIGPASLPPIFGGGTSNPTDPNNPTGSPTPTNPFQLPFLS